MERVLGSKITMVEDKELHQSVARDLKLQEPNNAQEILHKNEISLNNRYHCINCNSTDGYDRTYRKCTRCKQNFFGPGE
ncbi:MAG TPA: hypothetical protein VFV86_06285 [Nitrososphaeraceae archaeon]|nr:hypothetical protein [Nitrososphaeraceae archaeon]